MYLKIFLTGWVILLVALAANLLANRLGIETWYPFVQEIEKTGFTKAFAKTSTVSKLFLFVIYPGILGFSAYLFLKIYK